MRKKHKKLEQNIRSSEFTAATAAFSAFSFWDVAAFHYKVLGSAWCGIALQACYYPEVGNNLEAASAGRYGRNAFTRSDYAQMELANIANIAVVECEERCLRLSRYLHITVYYSLV